jgi:hypothetical protein
MGSESVLEAMPGREMMIVEVNLCIPVNAVRVILEAIQVPIKVLRLL